MADVGGWKSLAEFLGLKRIGDDRTEITVKLLEPGTCPSKIRLGDFAGEVRSINGDRITLRFDETIHRSEIERMFTRQGEKEIIQLTE